MTVTLKRHNCFSGKWYFHISPKRRIMSSACCNSMSVTLTAPSAHEKRTMLEFHSGPGQTGSYRGRRTDDGERRPSQRDREFHRLRLRLGLLLRLTRV